MRLQTTTGYTTIVNWLANKNHHPFTFQEETWQHIINGKSGLVNAPTGCGKTYSVFLGALIDFINMHPDNWQSKANNGIQLLWITPLRALAKDIGRAMEEVVSELGMQWKIGIRNGDTDINERQRQKRRMPEVLIITPESMHLLLAQKGYPATFETLQTMAVDEWHELIGSKRGVQIELAVSRLTALRNGQLKVWGISATIGNLEQAKEVLLSPVFHNNSAANREGPIEISREVANSPSTGGGRGEAVIANIRKDIVIESIIPDEIEKYPWAGHLGLKLIHKVLPILNNSRTTLIFINTRGMSEQWYQALLTAAPDLAGAIALHHGSIEQELRVWVEEALHTGRLKAVVCTASLDLGVDFRPVETVIQVGSPKGVARFLQRAGRSGHSPGDVSRIYFLPTHSLELVEAAALKNAVEETFIESKEPMLLCFDVLIQYLSTLAISDGFLPEPLLKELRSTYCYRDMTDNEWMAILEFITSGGNALQQYDEYKKVEVTDGVFRITSRRIAMRHRMHIGTIVSEAMMKVKFVSGGFIGVIEEWFITRLSPGDVFTLAGRNLELVTIKDMTALVRKSNSKKSIVPSWQGGRMPLSAKLGKKLREKFEEARDIQEGNWPSYARAPAGEAEGREKKAVGSRQQAEIKGKKSEELTSSRDHQKSGAHSPLTTHHSPDIELQVLEPLFKLQETLSHVPGANELLIEHIETKDGYHLFVYPFEGRLVHEAMAAILAWRISKITPITFSFAMNDYGFELLSDQPIPVDDTNVYELFTAQNLLADIQRSANATEMAKRKFRDIAVIGGLIFQGYPGEQKKARHLQSSASLLFNVFSEYEPGNLLLRQSYQEVFDQQMEEVRLRNMLERIQQSTIIITFPQQLTPFCFPIKVDSMRENLTSEKLEDRVKRMQTQLNGL
jgi:ATP-dependent Lhr-like helicase